MAAPQEFYIRNATESEARGPFNLEQVMSLAEAGQVTIETLYYDTTTEQWVAIGANDEVKLAVFPEKKKLTVNRAVKVATLNKDTDESNAISVTDMLAAAEGRTHDTKDKSDPAIARARAAKVGMWAAIAALVLSAAGEILPAAESIMTGDPVQIVLAPFAVLGFIDVFLALLLVLGVSAIYPTLRFRAALGLGFLGIVFWTQGLESPLFFVTLGSVGLYLCTICVGYLTVAIAAALAIVGMAGFTWASLMV